MILKPHSLLDTKLFHPHFTAEVLCHSDTALRLGLINDCPAEHIDGLQRLSVLLGQIESLLAPHRLKINSAYRSPELNECVGGVPGSQHTLGLAADWTCAEAGHPYALAQRVIDAGLVFDQLILEFNRWVHVSVPRQGQVPRQAVLSIFSGSEGYLDGLHARLA